MIYFGQDKMSEFYYGGTEIKEMYLGSTKVFQNKHPLFLTLETDGHGTLSADVLSGFEGDTVTLSPTYNTYYRFSGYDCTGGTIEGNTFTFGNENATAFAGFSGNAFTASGGFEKGSNQTVTSEGTQGLKTVIIQPKYAITSYHTSNVPASYYATSNRWKPPTGLSAYKITLNPKMTVTAQLESTSFTSLSAGADFTTLIGSTKTSTVSNSTHNALAVTWNYNKTVTSDMLNVYVGISGNIRAKGYKGTANARLFSAVTTYIANNTTGTWTATGYIP